MSVGRHNKRGQNQGGPMHTGVEDTKGVHPIFRKAIITHWVNNMPIPAIVYYINTLGSQLSRRGNLAC